MRPVTLDWDERLGACAVASPPLDGRDPCGTLPLPRPLDSIREYVDPEIGQLGFTSIILAGRVRGRVTGPPRDSDPSKMFEDLLPVVTTQCWTEKPGCARWCERGMSSNASRRVDGSLVLATIAAATGEYASPQWRLALASLVQILADGTGGAAGVHGHT